MWEAYKPQIRQLLLSTIKTDIKACITAITTKLNDECEKPLHIHDTREEDEELRRELEEAVNTATLKGRDWRSQCDNVEKEKEEEQWEEGGREVNDDNARESGRTEQDWGDDPNVWCEMYSIQKGIWLNITGIALYVIVFSDVDMAGISLYILLFRGNEYKRMFWVKRQHQYNNQVETQNEGGMPMRIDTEMEMKQCLEI